MKTFLQRFGSKITGILSGFDRLRLRGTKRLLAHVGGMMGFLWRVQVLLKDFDQYVQGRTGELCGVMEQAAREAQRPVLYLSSSNDSKEKLARAIAERDGVRDGLIAVLKCVEPCWSFGIYKNRETKKLELRSQQRKCLHYYHYYLHPQLGFLHTRLQTWFPFTMQVCLNGREWLARQLDQAGVGYVRQDNCIVAVEDLAKAQALLDEQLRVHWPKLLDELARQSNPLEPSWLGEPPIPYYWSADQSEWATDILFRSVADLQTLYPRLLWHGIHSLHCRDVLRFLGQRLTQAGAVPGWFRGEATTDLKERPEGMRLKHRVNHNSVKMYDKAYTAVGAALRLEATINDVSDFKVYRSKEGDEQGAKAWRTLRKGVADLHRRAEVSQQATDRYAESLATLEDRTPLAELAEPLCQPTTWKGRRVRGLNPLAPEDAALLETVNRGEFLLNGFRNRDLRPLLCSAASTPAEAKRQSAAVSRKLRLLRAHGLIEKVSKTYRYRLSTKGRTAIAALLASRQADTAKLTQAA
jgi:hypothetical protein